VASGGARGVAAAVQRSSVARGREARRAGRGEAAGAEMRARVAIPKNCGFYTLPTKDWGLNRIKCEEGFCKKAEMRISGAIEGPPYG
jgi:hypothetical protein